MPIQNLLPLATSHVPRLLLVDDDPDQLRLMIETMRSTAFRISLAMDGVQAYNRALSIQPDLILLDVRMPRLDGFALCRRLKANAATARIPVIFLSSASDIDDRLTGLQDGAVDYILKPYEPQEVVARVKIHLALSQQPTADADGQTTLPISEDDVLVKAAQQTLRMCLSVTPRAVDIAAKLGVHERRLARAFRNCLDTTLFENLRELRMEEAQRLLRETSLSVQAISQEVGFSNPANFSTAFREHVGMAPSAYRASVSDDPLSPLAVFPQHREQ